MHVMGIWSWMAFCSILDCIDSGCGSIAETSVWIIKVIGFN